VLSTSDVTLYQLLAGRGYVNKKYFFVEGKGEHSLSIASDLYCHQLILRCADDDRFEILGWLLLWCLCAVPADIGRINSTKIPDQI
jgi:hypothetical protein